MIKLTSFTVAIFFVALLVFWNNPVLAQLTRISVGYSAISGDALPAWVAKDAGIFEKNGLDVQLVFFTAIQKAVIGYFLRGVTLTDDASCCQFKGETTLIGVSFVT
jgi:ABC-type nitrate/sulfonate/bicarbonate transport system substrate-binding protein